MFFPQPQKNGKVKSNLEIEMFIEAFLHLLGGLS